jgi:hypothetical protein
VLGHDGEWPGAAALPGSPEKVAVLAERARRGLALWRPLDAALPRQRRQGAPAAALTDRRLVHDFLQRSSPAGGGAC